MKIKIIEYLHIREKYSEIQEFLVKQGIKNPTDEHIEAIYDALYEVKLDLEYDTVTNKVTIVKASSVH